VLDGAAAVGLRSGGADLGAATASRCRHATCRWTTAFFELYGYELAAGRYFDRNLGTEADPAEQT
jgi:hypothetical protein